MDLVRWKTKLWRIGLNVAAMFLGLLFVLNISVLITEAQRCEKELYKPGVVSWKPYSAPIESALAVLNPVRPEQVRYLRQKRIPLIVLGHEAFCKRFGCGPFGSSRAQTEGRSAIYLDGLYGRDAGHLAAALSHEEVHVEHGDRGTGAGQHSRLRHWLFQGEEDEAHLRGDATLLRTAGLRSWTASEYEDVLFRSWHWFAPALWVFLFVKVVSLSVRGISRPVESVSVGAGRLKPL